MTTPDDTAVAHAPPPGVAPPPPPGPPPLSPPTSSATSSSTLVPTLAATPSSSNSNSSSSVELSYGASLPHLFASVSEQVSAGLEVVRQTSAFIKKVVALHKSLGDDLLKAAESAMTKDIYSRDGMRTHAQTALQAVQVAGEQAQQLRTFTLRATDEVVSPMHDLAVNGEKTRKELHAAWKKATAEAKSTRAHLVKAQQECIKAYEAMMAAKHACDAERQKPKGNVPKAERKLEKAKEKAAKLYAAFRLQRDEGLAELSAFHTQVMPSLLQRMEYLEQQRLDMLKQHLSHYASLLTANNDAVPMLGTLTASLDALNARAEMSECVDLWISQHGPASKPSPVVVDLPCSLEDIESDHWFTAPSPEHGPPQHWADITIPGAAASVSRSGTPGAGVARAMRSSEGQPPSSASLEIAEALYPFRSDDPEDIHFDAGARLIVVSKDDPVVVSPDEPPAPAWWSGYIEGTDPSTAGKFPSNYVQPVVAVLDDFDYTGPTRGATGSLLITEEEPTVHAEALYDYVNEQPEEGVDYLSFSAGDMIEVTEQDSSGWWMGRVDLDSDVFGFFPASLVKIIEHKPAPGPSRPVMPARQPSIADPSAVASGVAKMRAFLPDSGNNDEGEPDAQDSGNFLTNAIRGKVSKKKRRFQEDGFDLDLSYITPKIIAMGFPSEGVEGVYRNPMSDVQRFFAQRHPGKFKVYNLCSERHYDPARFHGMVARFPFDDHNPCPISMIMPCMEDIHAFLNADPENIVAIHCKAGKGRTGFMIACYLVYTGMMPTVDEALAFYGKKRTYDGKGVTIASQQRYIRYFARSLRDPIPESRVLRLTKITIVTIPKVIRSTSVDVWFVITTSGLKWSSRKIIPPARYGKDATNVHEVVEFAARDKTTVPPLDDDLKIEVYHSTTFGKAKLVQAWLNTRFLDRSPDSPDETVVELDKSEIDKANKDHSGKFSESFRMRFHFADDD